MNFATAVRSGLTQYAGFTGRARRAEYWWFALFTFIVGIVASIIDGIAQTLVVSLIVELALLLPSLAIGVRRLHDTSRSGWWILIGLVPIAGAIVLIVFFCQDSHSGTNRFGPSPKYPDGGYGQYPPPLYPGPPGYPPAPPNPGPPGYPPPPTYPGPPGYPPPPTYPGPPESPPPPPYPGR